jgi:hypothetical protein
MESKPAAWTALVGRRPGSLKAPTHPPYVLVRVVSAGSSGPLWMSGYDASGWSVPAISSAPLFQLPPLFRLPPLSLSPLFQLASLFQRSSNFRRSFPVKGFITGRVVKHARCAKLTRGDFGGRRELWAFGLRTREINDGLLRVLFYWVACSARPPTEAEQRSTRGSWVLPLEIEHHVGKILGRGPPPQQAPIL